MDELTYFVIALVHRP